jgi:hypothetical protein
MGLFTRQPAATWQPAGDVGSNGDCGGDIQRGDSYSVRLVHPDMPGSLITVAFYAAEYDECPREFVVQRQVEWLVCADPADPGGTEIWSDYDYSDVSETVMTRRRDASREAKQHAEYVHANPDIYGGWDGQPDWSR